MALPTQGGCSAATPSWLVQSYAYVRLWLLAALARDDKEFYEYMVTDELTSAD